MKHIVKNLLSHEVQIDLVGVGGTGSLVLSGLVRLNHAIRMLGHPYGIKVTVYDPDTVSEANIGRQLFTADEIGRNKAECLVDRYNLGFALDWSAVPQEFHHQSLWNKSIVISCVDSKASRKKIFAQAKGLREKIYLIDSGNDGRYGQVLIGNGSRELPWPYVTRPDLLKGAEDRSAPSCSLAEALAHQDLFINQWMATAVLELLWQMFRRGELEYRGFYINLESGRMNPLPLNANKMRHHHAAAASAAVHAIGAAPPKA